MDDKKPGPTGKFSGEKIRPDDEGGLNAAISSNRQTNKVTIDFGKPVSWVAMTPDEARVFSMELLKHAKALDGGGPVIAITPLSKLVAATEMPSITCPVCGRTSYNTNDIVNKYCGFCHEFHDVLIQRTMPGPGRE